MPFDATTITPSTTESRISVWPACVERFETFPTFATVPFPRLYQQKRPYQQNRLNRRREQSIKAEPFYLLNRVAYWLHTGLGPSAEPQCEKDLLKPQTETLYFAAPGKQAQGIHSFMRPSSLHVAVRFWCGWWATPIISPSVCQMREWKGGNDAQFPRRSIDASGNPKAPKRPACRPAPAPCQRLHTSRGGAHSPRGSAPARRSWC